MSTKITGGDRFESAVKELADGMRGRGAYVDVGFQNGATEDDGMLTAAVAALNEYGVPSRGQPPRPFFRRMIAKEKGQWPATAGKLLKQADYDVVEAVGVMGDVIKEQIENSIRELVSPPLAQSTVDRKGFSKPLIDTGNMLNSVTKVVKTGDAE